MVVATPGRLLDLINEEALSLEKVTMLILDEADRYRKRNHSSFFSYLSIHLPIMHQFLVILLKSNILFPSSSSSSFSSVCFF